jgi:hypothetical protein
VQVVHRVAAVAGESGRALDVAAARLGVLARETTDLHDRDAGAVGEHDGHLQERADLAADPVGGVGREGLGAVAALQQERLAARDGGQPLAQVVALAGLDQRRDLRQRLVDGGERGLVGPGRLLQGRQVAPAVQVCGFERGGHALRG